MNGVEASHRTWSIEDAERAPAVLDIADGHDHAAIRLRLRAALEAFARLPDRRRDIKALQITGFSYAEIAEMRGLTYTRVNHVLAEANATLREQQGRGAAAQSEGPPRAVRLGELEREPPRWLRKAIGRVPSVTNDGRAVLAWRRAALAIDDYRRQYGRGLGDDPLGERPADREAARTFDLARSAIERVVEARSRMARRGLER